ncbi:ubiquitin-like domain-containing protein [Luteococcus peritonei]|uniref:Ubiquitin-like domain-containing protein n=1 Tax=Luteococcus peritonei TaxID=88874 RepID=A0ABW4RRY9_9ACTN
MKNKTIGIIASATAAVAALGGVGYTVADKEVQVAVDGAPATEVHTFGGTVADALQAKGITLGEHDSVVPSSNSPISDGTEITVNYGRPLTVTLDGKKTLVWTTATTLDHALRQLGVTDADARTSVSRSTPLGRQGLAVDVVTPKQVSLVVAGKKSSVESTAATVRDLLAEQKIAVGAKDVVKPALNAPVTDKLAVTVQRVTTKQTTSTEPIEHETVRTRSDSLDAGTTKVTTEGKDGVTTKTWLITLTDGKQTGKKLVSSKVTTKPVTEKVTVGTRQDEPEVEKASTSSSSSSSSSSSTRSKPAEKTSATASTKTASSSSSSSAGGSNLARAAMWDRIAQCESGGNWSINTGNGYYGGLQFDRQTWLANGGGAYAPTANLASRAQQITIANKLYAQRGLQPWGCAHAA